MIRVLLGVALAVALVAATTPALEDARADRTERLTARELGRVETAAETLAREEDPGARRTLRVSLLGESPTAAPLASVTLGGVPDDSTATVADTDERDVLAFRVAGGRRHVRRVETDLRVVRGGPRSAADSQSAADSRRVADSGAAADSQSLVLRGGQTYEVTLRLVLLDGRRIVTVLVR